MVLQIRQEAKVGVAETNFTHFTVFTLRKAVLITVLRNLEEHIVHGRTSRRVLPFRTNRYRLSFVNIHKVNQRTVGKIGRARDNRTAGSISYQQPIGTNVEANVPCRYIRTNQQFVLF